MASKRPSAAKAPAATEIVDVIVITTADNIEAAKSVAEGLAAYKTYCFDPGLVDNLMKEGFHSVEFINPQDCPDFQHLVKSSHALASQIEHDLDAALRDILPDVSIFSWQHLNYYYLLMAARWYNAIWHHLADRFAGTRPYIFVCDNPSQYYWPSFIPALTLLEILKSRGIEFQAYHYGERPDDTSYIPMLFGDAPEAGQGWDILTHMPTCFYDHKYFWDEIKASGKSTVNIIAKYWDVPSEPDKSIMLVRREQVAGNLTDEFFVMLEKARNVLTARLDVLLAPYIRTESFRQRQVQHQASQYVSQLITYEAMENYFADHPPGKIILSDHDAGFHGPIATYATNHSIPVLLLPHSKTSPDLETYARTLVALGHPMQAEAMNDLYGKKILNFKLAYPEEFRANSSHPPRIKTVGLLLNSLSLDGIFVTNYTPYLNGILRMVEWTRQHGLELKIRCRPGHTLINILATEAGIPLEDLHAGLAGNMRTFADSVDVCLMYDTPTTGCIDFLRNNIPILNPVADNLAKYEACIAPVDLVPRASVETILIMMHDFLYDEASFAEFRMAQFAGYVDLFKGARALRAFL